MVTVTRPIIMRLTVLALTSFGQVINSFTKTRLSLQPNGQDILFTFIIVYLHANPPLSNTRFNVKKAKGSEPPGTIESKTDFL